MPHGTRNQRDGASCRASEHLSTELSSPPWFRVRTALGSGDFRVRNLRISEDLHIQFWCCQRGLIGHRSIAFTTPTDDPLRALTRPQEPARPEQESQPLGPCPSRPVVKADRRRAKGSIVNGRACRAVKGGLVSTGSGDEERAWAADKRDFVADRRDEVADERDRVADTRDRTADDREAELGIADEESGASAQRAEARAGRSQARQNRDEARAKRTIAAADRDESTKRRQADAPPTRLAMVFADIAEQLYDADSFDDVLSRIAEAAVSTIAGCRMASVTLVERSGYRTAASTDPAATAVDQAQYQLDEGPCLDAVDAPMVYAQSFPDERWPTLASRPTESGVQSALSYRLAAASSATAHSGGRSLNSYGVIPYAFNDTAQEIGLILAAHASVAARAVAERSTRQSLDRDLQQALLSRDVIGQAKGILMERLKITPEDAFDLLRRSSQHLNLKLRDVARGLAETGELRMTRTSRPADQQ